MSSKVQCSGNSSDPYTIANEQEIHNKAFHFANMHNLDTVGIRIRGADDLDVSHNISQKLFLLQLQPPSQTCVVSRFTTLCQEKYYLQKMTTDPKALMKEALAEAKAGLSEGGLPIGE